MTTISSRYGELVERLYRKTMKKELPWEFNSTFGFCSVPIAGRSVFIKSNDQPDSQPYISLEIRNGDRVEKFTDEDLVGSPSIAAIGSWFQLMSELADNAKRQATGADEDIDAILDALDDDIPF